MNLSHCGDVAAPPWGKAEPQSGGGIPRCSSPETGESSDDDRWLRLQPTSQPRRSAGRPRAPSGRAAARRRDPEGGGRGRRAALTRPLENGHESEVFPGSDVFIQHFGRVRARCGPSGSWPAARWGNLITRRSRVRIPPPLCGEGPANRRVFVFHGRSAPFRQEESWLGGLRQTQPGSGTC